jgi:DNA-binding transcriptional regulator YiaG
MNKNNFINLPKQTRINAFTEAATIKALPSVAVEKDWWEFYKTYKSKVMMFNEQIKHLRKKRQIPQRELATVLEIDTATCYKIEGGEQ